MGLSETFSGVLDGDEKTKAVNTIVCDVFGTLILQTGLNKPLEDFLLRCKENHIDIYITSSDPDRAMPVLTDAGLHPLLLQGGVQNKLTLSTKLYDDGRAYLAIDDDRLVWLDAAHVIGPHDPLLKQATRLAWAQPCNG